MPREFTCNICGTVNPITATKWTREELHCSGCGSTARNRGTIFALQKLLTDGASLTKPMRWVRGIGCSDPPVCSRLLDYFFTYQNTYLHRPPHLDLMNLDKVSFTPFDFVVCSDVLEHVPPPVDKAMRNLRLLVKPGGALILTVPYLEGDETYEHYPSLHEWEVRAFSRNRAVLLNAPENGDPIEIYRDPFFHGGEGTTLEMRIFGETDLVARLHAAGFHSVEILGFSESVGYLFDFPTERPAYRGRPDKGMVMVCR
jgi:SAM-dependent methyltransferase